MDVTVIHTPAAATVAHTPAPAAVVHTPTTTTVTHTPAVASVAHNTVFAVELLTDGDGVVLTDDTGVELAAWISGHPATVEVN